MLVFFLRAEREAIEAAKTLLFGFGGSGAGRARRMQNSNMLTPDNSAKQSTSKHPPTSKLNSKRSHSEIEEDQANSDEELGFGDSEHFRDRKYGENPAPLYLSILPAV